MPAKINMYVLADKLWIKLGLPLSTLLLATIKTLPDPVEEFRIGLSRKAPHRYSAWPGDARH